MHIGKELTQNSHHIYKLIMFMKTLYLFLEKLHFKVSKKSKTFMFFIFSIFLVQLFSIKSKGDKVVFIIQEQGSGCFERSIHLISSLGIPFLKNDFWCFWPRVCKTRVCSSKVNCHNNLFILCKNVLVLKSI